MSEASADPKAPGAPQVQTIDPAALEKQVSRLVAQLHQALILYADIVATLQAKVIELETPKKQ